MKHLHDLNDQPTKAHITPTPSRPSLHQLLQDESGQDLIEYALVAALVGLAAVGAMRGLSTKISTAFNNVGNNLTSAI